MPYGVRQCRDEHRGFKNGAGEEGARVTEKPALAYTSDARAERDLISCSVLARSVDGDGWRVTGDGCIRSRRYEKMTGATEYR